MHDDDMLEMNDDLDEEELGLEDDDSASDDDLGPIAAEEEDML